MAIYQHWIHLYNNTFTNKIVPIVISTKHKLQEQEDVTVDTPKETIPIEDKHTVIIQPRISVSSQQPRSSHIHVRRSSSSSGETSLPLRIHYLITFLTLLLPLRYVIFSPDFYGTDTISWILQGIDASSSTTRDGILVLAVLNITYVSADVTFIAVTNHTTPRSIRYVYIIAAIIIIITCILTWITEIIFNQRYPAGIWGLIVGCSAIFVVCTLSISISILSRLLSSVSLHMDETSRIRCHARVTRLRQNMRYAWCAVIIGLLGCTYVAFDAFDDMNAPWIRIEKSDSMYDLPDYCHCILCLWLRWYFWIKKPIVVTTPSNTTGT